MWRTLWRQNRSSSSSNTRPPPFRYVIMHLYIVSMCKAIHDTGAFEHSVLRVWEIYALENVFYIACMGNLCFGLRWAIQTISFFYATRNVQTHLKSTVHTVNVWARLKTCIHCVHFRIFHGYTSMKDLYR